MSPKPTFTTFIPPQTSQPTPHPQKEALLGLMVRVLGIPTKNVSILLLGKINRFQAH